MIKKHPFANWDFEWDKEIKFSITHDQIKEANYKVFKDNIDQSNFKVEYIERDDNITGIMQTFKSWKDYIDNPPEWVFEHNGIEYVLNSCHWEDDNESQDLETTITYEFVSIEENENGA